MGGREQRRHAGRAAAGLHVQRPVAGDFAQPPRQRQNLSHLHPQQRPPHGAQQQRGTGLGTQRTAAQQVRRQHGVAERGGPRGQLGRRRMRAVAHHQRGPGRRFGPQQHGRQRPAPVQLQQQLLGQHGTVVDPAREHRDRGDRALPVMQHPRHRGAVGHARGRRLPVAELFQQRAGHGGERGAGRRQSDRQLRLAQHLLLPRQVGGRGAQPEVAVQPAVELRPVVGAVVVGGLLAHVQGAGVGRPEQGEGRLCRLVGAGDRLVRLEAAVVVAVEDEQGRARGEQGGQGVVIRHGAQVGGELLGIAHIRQVAPRPGRHVPGHRHHHPHPLVQRRQQHGLPAAAGEAGHGGPFRVRRRVLQQQVQRALHHHQEHARAALAEQVEQQLLVVRAQAGGLSHSQELEAQRQHAALGQVDAARLLVVHRHPAGVVPVGVQHRRHGTLPAGGGRLVPERRHPNAGIALEAQLADAILGRRLQGLAPHHLGTLLQHAGGMAAQQQLAAAHTQGGRLLLPRGGLRRQLQPPCAALHERRDALLHAGAEAHRPQRRRGLLLRGLAQG